MHLPLLRRQTMNGRRPLRLPLTALLLAVSALVARTVEPVRAQQPSMEQLRDAAGDYVRSAYPRLANLVGTEEYRQRAPGGSTKTLKSEVLLVPHPTETSNWLFFRDVLEVNRKPIPNQQERLTNLFISPSLENWELVRGIAHADRQYHISGSIPGLINPFIVVALVDRSYWPRLQFKLGKQDDDAGPGVWILELDELRSDQEEPLLASVPSRARAWVDMTTGRILKTELRIATRGGPSSSRTTFRFDEALRVTLPVEMKTTWFAFGQESITGTAKYSNYRQFSVKTEESLKGR